MMITRNKLYLWYNIRYILDSQWQQKLEIKRGMGPTNLGLRGFTSSKNHKFWINFATFLDCFFSFLYFPYFLLSWNFRGDIPSLNCLGGKHPPSMHLPTSVAYSYDGGVKGGLTNLASEDGTVNNLLHD